MASTIILFAAVFEAKGGCVESSGTCLIVEQLEGLVSGLEHSDPQRVVQPPHRRAQHPAPVQVPLLPLRQVTTVQPNHPVPCKRSRVLPHRACFVHLERI